MEATDPPPSSLVVSAACEAIGLRAGAIVFHDIVAGARPSGLIGEIATEAARVRASLSPRGIRDLAEVRAFGEILRKVGIDPKRHSPSVERLLAFALKHGDLPRINGLVDAYNLASIRSLCSVGAHDLDKIQLPIELRFFTGSESFIPLGGNEPETVKSSEFGYVDAAGRVVCRLDIRQADFSKVTPATRKAILIIEATAAHSPELVRKTMDDTANLVMKYCSGKVISVTSPHL